MPGGGKAAALAEAEAATVGEVELLEIEILGSRKAGSMALLEAVALPGAATLLEAMIPPEAVTP